MADKHDELALGMAKQLHLKTGDVIVNRQCYWYIAVEDTILTAITSSTEPAKTGETVTGTLTDKTITAGSQFPVSIQAATVTSGYCILMSRV
tara:strand:+ start:271 stop:546 length:276 start_codon:yes stop_codon:yes gene_type:complete